MPKDSLKRLLDMFPYFFNKESTSNFYKSQSVTNNRFQDIYQSLFDVFESFHLQKRCYIWKEQDASYDYVIHFVANFPCLKTVTLYKNDTVIYTDSFEYEDNVSNFEYSYSHSTLNDVESESLADIIPQDKFKMVIETFEEYTITKGFPENDTLIGNEYDHDESLDEIGALHNVPRKEYIQVDSDLYPATEPPYNDRLTEDDYHYMKRIIEYLYKYHTLPLPVAEIWKLYGIDATMENREKYLLKVFDENRHPFNSETGLVEEWTPKKWEHKDTFCDYSDSFGEYFFVKTSTNIPVKNQDVILYFKFLNSLGKELTGNYTVDISLDGRTLVENYLGSQYVLESTVIPQDKDNYFIITAKNSNGEVIGQEMITIIVRGCNNADFYVSPNGSDNNNGKTRNTAFKTIQKAVNSVNGDKNLIVLLTGDYEISTPIILNQSCTILGCGSVLIENLEKDLFFRLPSNDTLILQDLTLQYRGDVCNVTDTTFTNNNGDGSFADILILFTNAPILIMTKIVDVKCTQGYGVVGRSVVFEGYLKDKYNDPLSMKTITISAENSTQSKFTLPSGKFIGMITPDKIGDYRINFSFAGDSNYKGSNTSITIPVYMSLTEFLSDYDYIVTDLVFNETTKEWDYYTRPVSEIIRLEDLNGAVINLQYNGYDVQFERFHSYSTERYISKTDMMTLRGLLVGIQYDDYNIQYMTANALGLSYLTLNTESESYVVGDPITFTGTLLDKHDDPIPGKVVTVNNSNYTTDSNGEYTGTLTAINPGSLILTADYLGDVDYEESHATKTLTILISLESVLSDYDVVVSDLTYDETTKDWNYTTISVEDINDLSDLDNCIMNLNKVGSNVQFERYHAPSDNSDITKEELESLQGLLMGIYYDDYEIKYTQFK